MTNPRTRKVGERVGQYNHINEDGISGRSENIDDAPSSPSESLTQTDDKDDDEDDDTGETLHDCDTSTTFSLQECMNEFRARRIRRNSAHSRPKVDGDNNFHIADNCQENTEIDFIRQNLTNKEQERKCKPCKNGFCYCFTSDSGEGGLQGKCQGNRHHRRSTRRTDNTMIKNPGNHANDCQSSPVKSKTIKQFESRTTINRSITKTTTYPITAISCLETSKHNAPLIHITQELRDNCVISKVRVNKQKIESCRNESSVTGIATARNPKKVKKTRFSNEGSSRSPNRKKENLDRTVVNPYTPTAPTLEKISELDTPRENSQTNSLQRRHKQGGKLLHKRLSNASINYKCRNVNEAPPKPPRSYINGTDKTSISTSTLTSTSPSIREAEHILDEFLAKKGYFFDKQQQGFQRTASERNRPKLDKKSAFTTNLQRKQSSKKRSARTYPSLSDMERTMESKSITQYGKNIRKDTEKDIFIGWAEPKIQEMLNYDSKCEERKFRSTGVQAESQKSLVDNDNYMGPPKVELDMVDGIVKRNLATNVTQKGTPVKIHLFGTPTVSKYDLKSTQKNVWYDQWRNMSPWSNKQTTATTGKQENDDTTNPNRSTKSVSTSFLKTSKNKILRLVSPKKLNKDQKNVKIRKTSMNRTIGIQTSSENVHLQSNAKRSATTTTDSYHSPIETPKSLNYKVETNKANFNFNRVVHPPNRRKQNHTRNCKLVSNSGSNVHNVKEKTYHSYANDLDQEVTLSKMGYILSNIRAKLEASDDHAVRTFQEIQKPSKPLTVGQKRHQISLETSAQIHNSQLLSTPPHRTSHAINNEPIYSEIEEHSIHILESPHYDNHTGVKKDVDDNVDAIYAKVNKNKAIVQPITTPKAIALGQILHESLKNNQSRVHQSNRCSSFEMIDKLSEASTSIKQMPQTGSLNNIRVMDQTNYPRRKIDFNQSDMSLHQSGIFLDNLCKSELIVGGISTERLEKVENTKSSKSLMSVTQPSPDDNQNATTLEVADSIQTDSVSYEFPNEDIDEVDDANIDSSGIGENNVTIKDIAPPLFHNQSTPKKKHRSSYITKEVDQTIGSSNSFYQNNHSFLTNSYCPNESIRQQQQQQQQQQQTQSLNNLESSEKPLCCARSSNSAFLRCHKLKNILRKSFHRSRKFVRTEARRFSTSLSLSSTNIGMPIESTTKTQGKSQQIQTGRSTYSVESSLYLETLFALDETAPVTEQLFKAVSICRNLPELQVSPEMVEAERLLLYSTLKFERQLVAFRPTPMSNQAIIRFFIDDIYLQIQPDYDYDLFFNYFYIITFECDGVIKSTQSIECENGTVLFRECGIEYTCYSSVKQANNDEKEQYVVNANIFVLRLRKVSTLALEPVKYDDNCDLMSCHEIVSRFRLNDTFILTAEHFAPYEYVDTESKNTARVCMRAACSSIELKNNVQLKGRAELRLPKISFSGFLNVEDPHLQHNWNRRWCILDGIHLHIWPDINCINQFALFNFNLMESIHCGMSLPLVMASPESCARPRSFGIPYVCDQDDKGNEIPKTTIVYFSADNQNDATLWLNYLNMTLELIAKWL